jgi:hypothetical protein
MSSRAGATILRRRYEQLHLAKMNHFQLVSEKEEAQENEKVAVRKRDFKQSMYMGFVFKQRKDNIIHVGYMAESR